MNKIFLNRFILWIAIFGAGIISPSCTQNGKPVNAPPQSVLHKILSDCLKKYPWSGNLDRAYKICRMGIQIIDDDHGGVAFGSQGTGTICLPPTGPNSKFPGGDIHLKTGNREVWHWTGRLQFYSPNTGLSCIGIYGDCLTEDEIIGLYIDLSNSKINGTMYVSGDPRCSSGQCVEYDVKFIDGVSVQYIPCTGHDQGCYPGDEPGIKFVIKARARLGPNGSIVCRSCSNC